MKVKVSGWITPDGYNGTQASGTAHRVELVVEIPLDDELRVEVARFVNALDLKWDTAGTIDFRLGE